MRDSPSTGSSSIPHQKGDLAINATKGVFRLVGGKISKTNAIVITTPSSTIGIRGGITIFSVNQDQTTADFVFGYSMTVTASGQTQTATPGRITDNHQCRWRCRAFPLS